MKSSAFDGMYGKHFDFPIFENKFVIVESTGYHITIGIKDGHGHIYEWSLCYPFNDIANYYVPTTRDCYLSIGNCTNNKIEIIFTKDDTAYILMLVCTNQNSKPKPIKVIWK